MVRTLVKYLALGALVVTAAAAGLYQFAGWRVSLDGSGTMPRFVSSAPNYDALDADRAREQERHAQASLPAAPAPRPVGLPVAVGVDPPPAAPPSEPAAARAGGASPPAPSREEWPDFRGPQRDGRYRGGPLLAEWPRAGLPELWRRPIGPGYASFVAASGRAYTIEQRRAQEVVSAYDIDTGRELWTTGWQGEFREAMGGDGPRATPTYHDGRLYALGGLGELVCLDAATGEVLWQRNILADSGASNLQWGMAAAPLVVDDFVIVLPGGSRGRSVVAYDRLSGDRRWSALDDQQAYSSPMLVEIAGVRQVIATSATRVMGFTVEEGRLLWEYPWSNRQGINAAQPLLLGDDRVFVSASYGSGAAVFQVVREGSGFRTETVWANQRMKNRFTSSVLHDGYIYGLDEAILTCIDAATGEQQWKAGRYGYGQLMIAGDRLIVLAEDGRVALVRATPGGHEELATFQALEGKTWNHPVVVDDRLLLRNGREMAAYALGP